jgi:hypothetical protein
MGQESVTANAVTLNAVTLNAVTLNALTSNSISSSALTLEALEDPDARLLLRYLTSCALSEGDHFDVEVQGQVYGFDGELGLAPEWGDPGGSCDAKCRSWVSGCVLARVDYLGETTPISIRGNHPALSSTRSERRQFPDREAAYYGDIFASPQRLYACLSPGKSSLPRVCGPSIQDCGALEITGHCDDVCNPARTDGSFPKCRADDDGSGRHPHPHHHGPPYLGSVTVFLKP